MSALSAEAGSCPAGGRRGPWHFAHSKGAPPCPLHSEEVLKRFEAKLRLKTELENLDQLRISVTCRSRRGTRSNHLVVPHDWVHGWDEVRVDFAADGTAPDLLLLRDAQPMAAIEVRGSVARLQDHDEQVWAFRELKGDE